MKNKFIFLMAIVSFLIFLGTSQVYADIITPYDSNAVGDYWFEGISNPDWLNHTNEAAELAWLTALLGESPGDYLGKDEDGDYTPWDNWTYAVLKYGSGNDSEADGTYKFPHVAIQFESGFDAFPSFVEVFGGDYQNYALSHVGYYGTRSVPEPATMLLLGAGLMGLAAFGRKRFIK